MTNKQYNVGKENPRYKDGRYAGKKMTIRLTEEIDEKLTSLVKQNGISKNEMIVRLISRGIQGHGANDTAKNG